MSDDIQPVAQVDGNHYEAPDGKQHWDLMERFDVAYLEARGTAHIDRWTKKDEAETDLRKAASYLSRVLQAGRTTRRTVPYRELQAFMDANRLGRRSRKLMILILVNTGGAPDLIRARDMLLVMAGRVARGDALEDVDA